MLINYKHADKLKRARQRSEKRFSSLSSNGSTIHERLYQEKDKYFEVKKSEKNSKLEQELKQCTFKPKTRRNKDATNRSF